MVWVPIEAAFVVDTVIKPVELTVNSDVVRDETPTLGESLI